MRDVKNGSTNFVNRKRWVLGRFQCQFMKGAGTARQTARPRFLKPTAPHEAGDETSDETSPPRPLLFMNWPWVRFCWQEGFGAFSYGHSQLSAIIRYIRDQGRHHARRSFTEEYEQFLQKYEIEHDERHLFKQLN